MPIFVHVLFWSLGVLIVVAAGIFVGILWWGSFEGDFETDLRNAGRKPDASNSNDKGSFRWRNAAWLPFAISTVATILWINLLALFIQSVVWLYAGA